MARKDDFRRASDPETWDYRHKRTDPEYLENNERRRMRKNQLADVAIQRLFLFSLMFFLATLGVAGWLS